jgi:glycosyltransferase involved in cell wall biosynthesis
MTADAVGGVWQYALDLASTLGRHGVKVRVAVIGPAPMDYQRAEAAVRGIDLREGNYSLEWMENPWEDVARAGEWLLQLEHEFRPDVVHLNGYCHAVLPWRNPVIVTGHSCVRSWWRAVHGADAPAGWDRYSGAVAAGLKAARLVVAPTAAMLQSLRAEYGQIAEGCVIPNGSAAVDTIAEEAPVKSAFVLSAGRLWDEAKNIGSLCAAAPDLTWPVYVAGDDGAAGAAARCTGGVRYLGRLPSADLAAWYARAPIYALPARYEPFGLSILEAAAAGCALVLGDIPSLRENWSGAGLFVRPDSRTELVAAIEGLIRDNSRRMGLGRLAVSRARRFNLARMGDGYLRAYESVRTQTAVSPHVP